MSNFTTASELLKRSQIPSKLYFEKPREYPELITRLHRNGLKDPNVTPRIKIQKTNDVDIHTSKPISQLTLEFYHEQNNALSKVQGYAKFTDVEAIQLCANLLAYLRVEYHLPFSAILSQLLNAMKWKTEESQFFSTDANVEMSYENSWNCVESETFRRGMGAIHE